MTEQEKSALRKWYLGNAREIRINGGNLIESTWEAALQWSRTRQYPIGYFYVNEYGDLVQLTKTDGSPLLQMPDHTKGFQTALEKYQEVVDENDSEETPLENLRVFLSFALNGQDWLDVEPFLDALEKWRV